MADAKCSSDVDEEDLLMFLGRIGEKSQIQEDQWKQEQLDMIKSESEVEENVSVPYDAFLAECFPSWAQSKDALFLPGLVSWINHLKSEEGCFVEECSQYLSLRDHSPCSTPLLEPSPVRALNLFVPPSCLCVEKKRVELLSALTSCWVEGNNSSPSTLSWWWLVDREWWNEACAKFGLNPKTATKYLLSLLTAACSDELEKEENAQSALVAGSKAPSLFSRATPLDRIVRSDLLLLKDNLNVPSDLMPIPDRIFKCLAFDSNTDSIQAVLRVPLVQPLEESCSWNVVADWRLHITLLRWNADSSSVASNFCRRFALSSSASIWHLHVLARILSGRASACRLWVFQPTALRWVLVSSAEEKSICDLPFGQLAFSRSTDGLPVQDTFRVSKLTFLVEHSVGGIWPRSVHLNEAFRPQKFCDAMDSTGKWCRGTVLSLSHKDDGVLARIHFHGFPCKWDETIPSERIAPCGTYLREKFHCDEALGPRGVPSVSWDDFPLEDPTDAVAEIGAAEEFNTALFHLHFLPFQSEQQKSKRWSQFYSVEKTWVGATAKAVGVVCSAFDHPRAEEQEIVTPKGFQNVGNSCYLGSTVVALLHSPFICTFLMSNRWKAIVKSDGSFTSLLAKFLRLAQVKSWCRLMRCAEPPLSSSLDPMPLLRMLCRNNARFRNLNEQHDAAEALGVLLSSLDRELASPGPQRGLVKDLFEGQLESSLCCQNCSYSSKTVDSFQTLMLPLSSLEKTLLEVEVHLLPQEMGTWPDPVLVCGLFRISDSFKSVLTLIWRQLRVTSEFQLAQVRGRKFTRTFAISDLVSAIVSEEPFRRLSVSVPVYRIAAHQRPGSISEIPHHPEVPLENSILPEFRGASRSILVYGNSLLEVMLGTKLDVKDDKGKWYKGMVVAMGQSGRYQTIKINYNGFSAKWDETIVDCEFSKRFAPLGCFTGDDLHRANEIQLIFRQYSPDGTLLGVCPPKIIYTAQWLTKRQLHELLYSYLFPMLASAGSFPSVPQLCSLLDPHNSEIATVCSDCPPDLSTLPYVISIVNTSGVFCGRCNLTCSDRGNFPDHGFIEHVVAPHLQKSGASSYSTRCRGCLLQADGSNSLLLKSQQLAVDFLPGVDLGALKGRPLECLLGASHASDLEEMHLRERNELSKMIACRPASCKRCDEEEVANHRVPLEELFSQFCSTEELPEWQCSECEERSGERQLLFKDLPDLLMIQLVRFSHSGAKLHMLVDFPLNDLDLGPWAATKEEPHVYDLYAVVNHLGCSGAGHYTTACRSVSPFEANLVVPGDPLPSFQEWWKINDSRVTNVDIRPDGPDSCQKIGCTLRKRLVTDSAYLLFYIRREPKLANVVQYTLAKWMEPEERKEKKAAKKSVIVVG